MPRSPGLEEVVDAAWAARLGCAPALLQQPGAHLVPGGEELRHRAVVLAARVGAATLVFCPDGLRDRAVSVLAEADPSTAFSAGVCARVAGVTESDVLGPSCHAFVDRGRFKPRPDALGRRLDRDDPLFDALRTACGEDDWAEGGFLHEPATSDVLYGLEEHGRLVAAGNMTPYRGLPADVGLVTHPDARGRGLATRLASKMVSDALPDVEVVCYRALLTNARSLRIAESLGFERRGQNYIVRLDPGLVATTEMASAANRNPPRSSASTSDAT